MQDCVSERHVCSGKCFGTESHCFGMIGPVDHLYPNSVVHSPVVTAAVCVEMSAQLCVCQALVGCGNTHLGILQ